MAETTLVDKLVRFEAGVMEQDEVIELFQQLVDNGLAWKLQGFYGRAAKSLIEAGMVKS